MPQNPPDHQHFTSFGTIAIWAVVAAIGAGLASLRRTITMMQAALHVATASFIGACVPYAILAVWRDAPWYVGIPISMVIGLMIFGIAVMMDKTEKRVGQIDATNYLPEKYRPSEQKKPEGK